MIRGVGIDMVEVATVKRLTRNPSFVTRTFTEEERIEAERAGDPSQYFAGRFAVKEAAFKATAAACSSASDIFDLRQFSCLKGADGAPRVVPDEAVSAVLEAAGWEDLLVSLTHEGGWAIAIVMAQDAEQS